MVAESLGLICNGFRRRANCHQFILRRALMAKQIRTNPAPDRAGMRELADRADQMDPRWYADWCEREGSDEELAAFVAGVDSHEGSRSGAYQRRERS